MAAPVLTQDGRGTRPGLEVRQARRAAAGAAVGPVTRRQRREADRRRRRGRWGLRGPVSVAGRLLLVVLTAVLLAGGLLVLSGRRAGAPSPGGAGAAVAPAVAVEAAGTATVDGVDPGAQQGASPARVLQGLLDARAVALVARDPALLVRAEGAGSSARTADAALLRRLLSARQTYDGLAFTAHDVVVVSRTGEELVLRARVARAAYELVGADGSRTPQPGSAGVAWRYVLRYGAGGWRLTEVAADG